MPVNVHDDGIRQRALSADGFTMIITLGVMLVTSLLLVAAFAAANGDSHLSRADTTQKQAYYAALAGVQEYEYRLQANPDFWQTCEGLKSVVPEELKGAEVAKERYEVALLPASTAPSGTKECSTTNPFETMIESKGAEANTFRVKSTGFVTTTGYTRSAQRTIIATFQVTGFLDYIYFTNFETEDPGLYNAPPDCVGHYYSEWSKAEENGKKVECHTIQFTTGDHVNGPMHTNDAAKVVGTPTFGRANEEPPDAVEIDGGIYPGTNCTEVGSEKKCCTEGGAKFYTETECFTKGQTLLIPPEDTSLTSYVEAENEFAGVTHLELKGSTSEIAVTYFKEESGKLVETKKTIKWPKNGLIYVRGSSSTACGYTYETTGSDSATETSKETGCGNVYVKGSYSQSLTIAAEGELIINGNVYPNNLAGSLGSEPTGTAVLGLIATEYVRVYHPCTSGFGGGNGSGSLENPYIYAAVLSTSHSFIVDNYSCGAPLGELHEYGAIAQNYRGPVGTGSSTSASTGYLKDYKYDGRLATEEPPYFLAPLKAGWKVARETTP